MALLLAVLATTACHGYYPSFRYAPNREVHEFRLESDADGPPAARVIARVVGILRPGDQADRRIHARFDVENPGERPLTFKTGETRAVPSTTHQLAPTGELRNMEVHPGKSRTVDLFFVLPPRDEVPAAALSEITLEWVIAFGGKDRRSSATFERRRSYSYYDDYYYYYGPYYSPYLHLGYLGHHAYRGGLYFGHHWSIFCD